MENSQALSSGQSAPLPRFKRRIFIVKKKLQAKFIVLVMVFVFVAICLMGWDFYDTFGRNIVQDFMDPGLYELFRKVSFVLIAKLSLYMMAVVVVAALISNKLAGPIYRFEKSARIVAEGDLTHRIHLRRGDELVDLQDEFNAMIEALHKHVAKNAHLAKRISTHLQELSHTKDISPDVLKKLQDIKTEVDHLQSGFKI